MPGSSDRFSYLRSSQSDYFSASAMNDRSNERFGDYLVGDQEANAQKSGFTASRITKILLLGIAFASACILLFTPGLPTNVLSDNNPGNPHPDDPIDPDEDKAFAVSGDHFCDAHSTLGNLDLTDGWSGNSGSRHGDHHIGFKTLATQAADTSHEVDTTVQTQAEQVNTGKATLENVLTGLQLAVPVAESLYFSGPAGPALSHHYQLAMTNAATETSADTTKTMHENAQMHAQRLTKLAQQYDQAWRSVPAINTAPALHSH